MGNAIAFRALNGGHEVIAYDTDKEACDAVAQIGADCVDSIAEVGKRSRVIWLMVPIQYVDDVLDKLVPHLKADDIVITGTCVVPVPISAGQDFVADFGTLGKVRTRLTD